MTQSLGESDTEACDQLHHKDAERLNEIETPNDEKKNYSASGYITFTTPVSWWVYVLFDSRSASVPAWLDGWERYTKYPNLQTSLVTQPGLKMYRRMFDAGECVNLGGNYGPGSSGEYRSNYVVVYGK